MKITLSVATSADHAMDDMSHERLTLSTPEDWAEVYRLRAESDAILVGGETLRRDNPSLGIKGEGREPVRVIVSGRGEISREAKIFHRGSSPIIIFSNVERPELREVAEVVVAEVIDVALIVTELEKRGLGSLFVEGGAQILRMFLASGVVDRLRVAVNPQIEVGDALAPSFDPSEWSSILNDISVESENLGGMEVSTYTLTSGKISDEDERLMSRVVEVSKLSPPKDSCYRVGALVKCLDGAIFEGYTLETGATHHAEQAAMYKALEAGADLRGATIYASMEPCSVRSSERESCSQLILRYGLKRVLFALYEPSHFVICHGAENLRRAGVEVLYMPNYEAEVRKVNRHIL
ncbi:MAG: dihydrofolate reductase family protein [Rikenellaceae bacterium]